MENEEAKTEERRAKRQLRQEARKNLLLEAIGAFGLEIAPYDLSMSIFSDYIEYGQGDPNQIAIKFNEKRFFERFTRFPEIDREMSRRAILIYFHEVEEIKRNAQNQALEEWARAFPSHEAALADPNLPESLKGKVRKIEMNE